MDQGAIVSIIKSVLILSVCVLLIGCSEQQNQIGGEHTQGSSSPCTDNSRACLSETAMSYIEALWATDGTLARLHPNARRTHNGGGSVDEGGALIAEKISADEITGYKNLRLIVDDQKGDVFAFWIVEGPRGGAHVAERIRAQEGLITEIEVFVAMDERPIDEIENLWPDKVENGLSGHGCATPVRQCLYEIANTYLNGLVIADGSSVKFAPDVRRTQNGGNVQIWEKTLRASVDREKLAFKRNFRLFADESGGEIVAVWLTGTDRPGHISTAHVIERLRVQGGLITEIEVFYTLEEGTLEGTSGWPDDLS